MPAEVLQEPVAVAHRCLCCKGSIENRTVLKVVFCSDNYTLHPLFSGYASDFATIRLETAQIGYGQVKNGR